MTKNHLSKFTVGKSNAMMKEKSGKHCWPGDLTLVPGSSFITSPIKLVSPLTSTNLGRIKQEKVNCSAKF